jgi:hypothetical protein
MRRASPGSAAVLATVLRNAATQPGEAKFRRLRLSNAKVAEAVVASGALRELLLPCFGWALQADEAGTAEGVAVQSDAALRLCAREMLLAAERLTAGGG